MKIKFSLKAFLLAFAVLALTGLAFSSTKAYAKTDSVAAEKSTDYSWSYDATQDAVIFKSTSGDALTLNIINGKDKGTKSASKADKTVKADTTAGAAFALGDKSKGINQAVNKDITLFVTSNKITKGEYTCDIKVNKTEVGAIKMNVLYTMLGSNQPALEGQMAPASDKKSFAESAKTNFEFAEYNKTGKKYTDAGWQTIDNFTGEVLESLLTRLGKREKVEIHVRYKGTNDTDGNGSGVRPSKIAKLKLAKQGKLAVVKFDNKKNAVALKNGYDFYVTTSTGSAIAYDAWTTILPYNKKTENSVKSVTVGTYKPAKFDKDDDTKNANAWTNVQVKSVALDDALFTEKLGQNHTGDWYLYYRKSAAAGKPAAAYSTGVAFCIKAVAAAPVQSGTKLIAASGNSVALSIKKADSDTCSSTDLECAIIAKSDLATLDMSSVAWKKFTTTTKFKAATTKTSKYMVTGETKAEAHSIGDLSEAYVIVRRSAPKVKTEKEKITTIYPASAYVKVEFTVDDSKVVKAEIK